MYTVTFNYVHGIYIYIHTVPWLGLLLSPLATKSGHPTGLNLCYSINAITSVLQSYISGIDTPRSPGSVLYLMYI